MHNIDHITQTPSLMCKAYTEPFYLLVKPTIKHELNILTNKICCELCEIINDILIIYKNVFGQGYYYVCKQCI